MQLSNKFLILFSVAGWLQSEDLHFSFGQLDTTSHTLEINLQSWTQWDGGQIDFNGINIVDIEPGLSSDFGQLILADGNRVLIFSFLVWLPITEGVYFTIIYDDISAVEVCFEDAYFTVPGGEAEVTFGPCIEFFNCNIIGDINNDTMVDILDIICLVNCIIDQTFCQCSDINSDDEENIQDILEIVSIIIQE